MLHRVSLSQSPISRTLYVYGTFTAGQQELAGNDDRERRLAESGDSLLIFSYQAIAIPVEAGDAEVPPYGLI